MGVVSAVEFWFTEFGKISLVRSVQLIYRYVRMKAYKFVEV